MAAGEISPRIAATIFLLVPGAYRRRCSQPNLVRPLCAENRHATTFAHTGQSSEYQQAVADHRDGGWYSGICTEAGHLL